MSQAFANAEGSKIVLNMIEVVKENRAYLSEVDGAIGDGDHGINMAKGFSMAGERIAAGSGFSEALKTLGRTLMMEIGGSMGPLYGGFFKAMAKAAGDAQEITAELLGQMLEAAYGEITRLGNATVGDKTLVDTLDPAIRAYKGAIDNGKSFSDALEAMRAAAEQGKESTRDLVAKVGRSARLGERSRGVLDAGATSCWLILDSMAGSIQELMQNRA